MVLSESFSDPLRAPRVSYSIDPMPQIRAIKEQTTSGLMLSPGYGGGTANIEYQEITGLSLSNFSDSMSVPYQQLVPNQKILMHSISSGRKDMESNPQKPFIHTLKICI